MTKSKGAEVNNLLEGPKHECLLGCSIQVWFHLNYKGPPQKLRGLTTASVWQQVPRNEQDCDSA
jgi:hypothetical protein